MRHARGMKLELARADLVKESMAIARRLSKHGKKSPHLQIGEAGNESKPIQNTGIVSSS
jgi:hypothetical protein